MFRAAVSSVAFFLLRADARCRNQSHPFDGAQSVLAPTLDAGSRVALAGLGLLNPFARGAPNLGASPAALFVKLSVVAVANNRAKRVGGCCATANRSRLERRSMMR